MQSDFNINFDDQFTDTKWAEVIEGLQLCTKTLIDHIYDHICVSNYEKQLFTKYV